MVSTDNFDLRHIEFKHGREFEKRINGLSSRSFDTPMPVMSFKFVPPGTRMMAQRLWRHERQEQCPALLMVSRRGTRQSESSFRTISAPAARAFNLPRATSRGKGAIPQFVQG